VTSIAMSSRETEVVYALKLLNSDSHRLACDSLKVRNDKYSGCEDGWVLKGKSGLDDHPSHHRSNDRGKSEIKLESTERQMKFRQVWIQGFVVEYVEAKDWLLVDDGTGSPWTVVNASKNPTSTKWLKDKDGSFAADERFYVLVLAEPVVLRDSNSKAIHLAAIKVQNLTSHLPSFTLADVDSSCRTAIEKASKLFQSVARSDVEMVQLYQWILEVEHMHSRTG